MVFSDGDGAPKKLLLLRFRLSFKNQNTIANGRKWASRTSLSIGNITQQ